MPIYMPHTNSLASPMGPGVLSTDDDDDANNNNDVNKKPYNDDETQPSDKAELAMCQINQKLPSISAFRGHYIHPI